MTRYRLKLLVCTGISVGIFLAADSGCRRDEARSPPSSGSTSAKLRVVTLTPSLTQVVDALGAIDLVVGVDKFSDSPEVVTHLSKNVAKVGDFLSPNLEAVLSLHPDIVLLDAVQEKFVTPLKDAGIKKVYAIEMQSVGDVRAAIQSVGEALGRAELGKRVVADLDAALAAETQRAEAAAAKAGKKPRVLFVVDRRPGGLSGMVAAAPGTYLDELLQRAAATNVLADAHARYVQLPAEEVIRRAPDVIFDAAHDATERGLVDWAPLASVPAVAEHHVYLLGGSVYVTPGPRLAEALAGLVDYLWGPHP